MRTATIHSELTQFNGNFSQKATPFSALIPFHVLFDPDLNINHLRLYGQIAQMETNKNCRAYFSYEWFAEQIKIKVRSVKRIAQKLKEKHLITREKNSKGEWIWGTVKTPYIASDNTKKKKEGMTPEVTPKVTPEVTQRTNKTKSLEDKKTTAKKESKPNQENPTPLEPISEGDPVVFSLEADKQILETIKKKTKPETWPLDRISQHQWLKEIEFNYRVIKPEIKTIRHKANAVCKLLNNCGEWSKPSGFVDLEAKEKERKQIEARQQAQLKANEKAHWEKMQTFGQKRKQTNKPQGFSEYGSKLMRMLGRGNLQNAHCQG
jgi:hypothetical protein